MYKSFSLALFGFCSIYCSEPKIIVPMLAEPGDTVHFPSQEVMIGAMLRHSLSESPYFKENVSLVCSFACELSGRKMSLDASISAIGDCLRRNFEYKAQSNCYSMAKTSMLYVLDCATITRNRPHF